MLQLEGRINNQILGVKGLTFLWYCSHDIVTHRNKCLIKLCISFLGEQQDAVDNLITAMDLTDAQRWVIFSWYKMIYLTALYSLSDHSFRSWCLGPHTVFILWLLTLYTPTLVCIFSTLFFIHFPRCWQGEFVIQSKGSLPGDHFLYSHYLNVWFRSDIVRRN